LNNEFKVCSISALIRSISPFNNLSWGELSDLVTCIRTPESVIENVLETRCCPNTWRRTRAEWF